uniref:C2H2-type domain-containing protein n=1 Tax=Moniliophthora roreri TaxID=221103 RepID=A0A0W0EV89_MONRR
MNQTQAASNAGETFRKDDWRPNLNIIRNQDQENMMTTTNSLRSISLSVLSAPRTSIPSLSAEYHPISDADDVALAQASMDNSTSNRDPIQVDLGSIFPASGFRSQVGVPAAAEASKSLRKKAPVYFCPFPKCKSHGFTEKHNFKYHWNSHMGIKPYACPKCKRGFGSKWDLRRHLKAKTLACANRNSQS